MNTQLAEANRPRNIQYGRPKAKKHAEHARRPKWRPYARLIIRFTKADKAGKLEGLRETYIK